MLPHKLLFVAQYVKLYGDIWSIRSYMGLIIGLCQHQLSSCHLCTIFHS